MKKTLIIFSILIITYAGAWGFMAVKINQSIDQFYDHDFPAIDGEFFGDRPQLSGFPLTPVITYQGGLGLGNADIKFDEMTLSGFPIPYLPLTLELAAPFTLTDRRSRQSLDLDYFKLSAITPTSLPNSSRAVDIQKWQQKTGHIDIESLEITKDQMMIITNGQLGLDDKLQANIILDTQMTGHAEFIAFLVDTKQIQPIAGAIALSALNAMRKEDAQTGADYVEIQTRIQNQKVSMGPVRLMTLPPIIWAD